MVEAPTAELSAVVQWYYRGYNIGLLVQDTLKHTHLHVCAQKE